MDFNQYLLNTLMPYGRYDPHGNGTVHKVKRRIYLNYFCAFVSLFCALKSFVIMVTPWTKVEVALYLIEVYVANHPLQRFLLQCLTNLHLTVAFSYLYWGYLNSNPNKMRCLTMFFLPDIKELCKLYGLKRKQAEQFVEKAKLYKRLMYGIMISFSITFSAFLLRCLLLGYLETGLTWLFFNLTLPMALITFFSFHCLIMYTLSAYLLCLLTMDFLILRLSTISEKLTKLFRSNSISGRAQNFSYRIVLLKGRPDMMRIMRSINEVVVQFKVSDSVFSDNLDFKKFANLLLSSEPASRRETRFLITQ